MHHRNSTTLLSCALLGAAIGCQGAEEGESGPRELPNAEATRVETMTVAAAPAKLSLRVPGEVEGLRESHLATPQGGYVEKVLVKEGDSVRSGQSMAWINRGVLDAQLESAAADLELAKYETEVVEKAGSSVSKTRRVRAQAQLKSAEARYRLAQINAGFARIRAPFAGKVSKVFVEQGEVTNAGDPVVRLVVTQAVTVSMSISDRDARWVQKGAPATIFAEGGARRIETTVTRVSPAADTETRTFIAEIDLEKAEGVLRPGMLVSVAVEGGLGEAAISIPQFALVTRAKGNGVFVVEEGHAVWRDIEIGGLLGHDIVVDSGLSEGEVLAVRGHRELADGDEVIVVNSSPTPDTPVAAVTDGEEVAPSEDAEQ